jgi:hypothetical protein
MAPPVDSTVANVAPQGDSVFNWQEVPQDQNVPITRAVFDQGGYQLYDTQGETIVVPFQDQNLYVMKFAVSDTGSMYFVNTGDAPVLYVPENGYLENASVPGAKWYPFTPKFHPATPVFLGIAPSWHVFIGMGWYPDMFCYGGYWCTTPFAVGVSFWPTADLFFVIGGAHFWGWGGYDHYFWAHPAPYRVTIVNNNIYRWGGRPWHGGPIARPFMGTGHPYYANRGFGGGTRVFRGAGQTYAIHEAINRDGAGFSGHTFRGAGEPAHAGFGGYHGVASDTHAYTPGAHVFHGADVNSGGHAFTAGSYGHTFQGASHGATFSHSYGGSFGSGHTFQGASHESATYSHGGNSGGHTFQGASGGGDHHDDGDHR